MKKLCLLAVSLCLVTTMATARPLKQGMSGSDVKQWQQFLNTRGFDVPTNGKFGPATQRATIIFQKKWKLRGDGIVGVKTLTKAQELKMGASQPITKNIAVNSSKFPYSGRWTGQFGTSLDSSNGVYTYSDAAGSREGTWRMEGRTLILTQAPTTWGNNVVGCRMFKFTPHANGQKIEMVGGVGSGTSPRILNKPWAGENVVLTRQW